MKFSFFLSFHHGYDVHYMGIILHFHKLCHLDGSKFWDPSHVISRKIHQHNMFGAFLFIPEQFIPKQCILLSIHTPAPGSGDRTGIHPASLLLYNHFRGTSDHYKLSIIEIIQIRGWIQFPEFFIQLKSGLFCLNRPSLGKHGLENMSFPDILLDLFDFFAILF